MGYQFLIFIILYFINAHAFSIGRQTENNETVLVRSIRSGGYPKFPTKIQQTCGQRMVNFVPERSPKIVGGVEPPYGSYPWQVDIKMLDLNTNQYGHHCGGAMIGPKLVLTAAHCLRIPIKLDHLRVAVGEHRLERMDEHENSYRVDEYIIHPDFRKLGPYSHDIAMLRLVGKSSGVPFNTFVSPICLPQVEESPPPGTWCSVTGWGAQNEDEIGNITNGLRAAGVPILDLETCRRPDVYGGRQQQILDTMVCAGILQGGVDACLGDSGGPMACEYRGRYVLAGIVSWGDGCAKRNRPGVYTRVSSYVQWIYESAAKLGVTIS